MNIKDPNRLMLSFSLLFSLSLSRRLLALWVHSEGPRLFAGSVLRQRRHRQAAAVCSLVVCTITLSPALLRTMFPYVTDSIACCLSLQKWCRRSTSNATTDRRVVFMVLDLARRLRDKWPNMWGVLCQGYNGGNISASRSCCWLSWCICACML